jgi:hypothetical protein
MHTMETLIYEDFDFEMNGHVAQLEDVFPGFNQTDRIGVVVRQPGGGMGASGLIMAAVTRFYDFYREYQEEESSTFRIYPEFFIFHVGKSHMNHFWMDIWPPHKEVIVEDDPEQILEAINDRGITRLLVEDINPSIAVFLRETTCSAEHRIVNALAYSPSGRVGKGDVKIMSCLTAEGYVLDSLNMSEELSEEVKEGLRRGRQPLLVNGRVAETYRRIEVCDAIHMLTQATEPGHSTLSYLDILAKS